MTWSQPHADSDNGSLSQRRHPPVQTWSRAQALSSVKFNQSFQSVSTAHTWSNRSISPNGTRPLTLGREPPRSSNPPKGHQDQEDPSSRIENCTDLRHILKSSHFNFCKNKKKSWVLKSKQIDALMRSLVNFYKLPKIWSWARNLLPSRTPPEQSTVDPVWN